MSLFSSKLGPVRESNQLTRIVDQLMAVSNSGQVASANVAKVALATESIREEEARALQTSVETLSTSLEAIVSTLGIEKLVQHSQIQAGTVAGVVAGDIRSFLSMKPKMPAQDATTAIVQFYGPDGYESRPFALEAYDDRDNRNAAIYSIAYNMQASRQDEFGETFYPTIVITPDQVGMSITVRLMSVYNDLLRQTSGALDNYMKKNIIRAIADYTILKNEMTRIIPVYRDVAKDNFVDPADVVPYQTNLEGETIMTAPLAVGKRFSLLGISQTDTLLASGVLDVTDSIEPAIRLQAVYVKVGKDVYKFDVSGLPLAEFTYSVQNNYRVQSLNFDSTGVVLSSKTKRVDGTDPVTLAAIKTYDLKVRLQLNVTGTVNIELADTQIFGNNVSIYSVQNAAGEVLALSDQSIADVVAAFANAKIIGYDLLAYRSNMNRRQRGQLVDITYYTQVYNVAFRSPITAIHPVTTDGQTDASDLQALITATRIRTSNAAVTELMNAVNTLREYVAMNDYTGLAPDTMGIGRFFVKPVYYEEAIDMNAIVDSLKSHERAEDMQAALVNKIRDYAYRMYRDSEYKAAADALAGGIAPVPTVIIGTDPVLARYLNVTGDLRTLGGEFNVRVVSTLDYRVEGKIFVTFGVFDETRNTQPNPLNFGNMAWSPELTVVLPIARNGQISKELAVSPRFRHITHLPVLTVLQVSNVPDVINKVPLYNTPVSQSVPHTQLP